MNNNDPAATGAVEKPRAFLFGQFVDLEHPLDGADIAELLAKARARVHTAARIPVAEIIAILHATGTAWAREDYPLRQEALANLREQLPFSEPMTRLSLSLLPSILEAHTLEHRVRAELGPSGLHDGWNRGPESTFSTALCPRGVLVHVCAGNVFLGSVDSLVMGLLTRNVNVLKLSSADPYFPLTFARSLVEHDPAGLLTSSIAIVPWRGGDEAIESVIKQRADTIMVWGGEDAVRNYRTGLGLGTRLVEYGPKLSSAVITRRGLAGNEPAAVASRIARDVAMWDQAACSSPQTIYVQDLDDPESGVRALIPHLLSALEKIGQELPLGKISQNEAVEIRKVREMARFGMAQGEAQIWESPGGMRYTVIQERRAGFIVSPLSRTLFIKAFRDLKTVYADLEPVGAYLQSVAVLAAADEIPELTFSLAELGANRFPTVGSMSEVRAGAPHDGRYPLGELVRRVALETESNAPAVDRQLAALLAHAAARSPFYARRMKGIDPQAPDALEQLPLLSKDDVYLHTPPVGSDLLTGPIDRAVVFASGGSTGQPKYSYYTNEEFDRVTSVLAQLMVAAGLSRGDRVANLFVAGQLWSSFLAVELALRKLPCLNLPIEGHSDKSAILAYLRTFKANVVVGLPSMILALAQYAKEQGGPLPQIEKIFYGGEHVSEEMRDYLSHTLGTTVVRSAGYASVDAGTIGYQCAHAIGSIHHLVEGHQFIELLDPATGQPVRGKEPGEIVVTSLERFLIPMIRYRTGDLARAVTGLCACGRSDRRFELLGRCDDRLQIGGARVVIPDISRALATIPALSPLFQLEASRVGPRERLTIRVELNQIVSHGIRALEKTVREAVLAGSEDLRVSVEKGWLKQLVIELLPPGQMPRLARTQKVRVLVDLRSSKKP